MNGQPKDNVWRFSQCVLAEVETLQLLSGTTTTLGTSSTTTNEGNVAAKVKALEMKEKGKGKGSPGSDGKDESLSFLGVQ